VGEWELLCECNLSGKKLDDFSTFPNGQELVILQNSLFVVSKEVGEKIDKGYYWLDLLEQDEQNNCLLRRFCSENKCTRLA